MRVVQIKPIWGLFWVRQHKLLEAVPVSSQASIPPTHQLLDPLLQESLHHCGLDISVCAKSTDLWYFCFQ
jgi:hypothetical protein